MPSNDSSAQRNPHRRVRMDQSSHIVGRQTLETESGDSDNSSLEYRLGLLNHSGSDKGKSKEKNRQLDMSDEDNRDLGPIDLDELFIHELSQNADHLDDDSVFSEEGPDDDGNLEEGRFFQTPELLNDDATNIPGSPWAKPPTRRSNRPTEPLPIAKQASTIAFGLSVGMVVSMFVLAIWNYSSLGRISVELLLAVLSFFGLFWNSYFTVSSVLKCFIPREAFLKNTKYCSMIPEGKQPADKWLDVTIQIPVYKESLQEVLMPTLNSCLEARNHYIATTQREGKCNIVVCDDGMMAFLNNNFPAAEMLWQNVVETKGRIIKLSLLLKRVPRVARRHLKGLRSKNIYEVFHRMLFYYHYRIGFVARSTIDRRGKFKKASNLNSHLRLVFGALQLAESQKRSFDDAMKQVSHSEDGSRLIMFGNNVSIGDLIVVNDADARMHTAVIYKTVPEFLNDKTLGFTQHATKTMDDQRGESYFLKLLEVYTDALYQGHFLLSSILGCHPPLVGHSIFLRSEALKQCGRMRSLRSAQRWLNNIGLPFLSVDQIGFGNLQKALQMEYWSESHVSEDFELMIHLYNVGYNGRYIAYPGCEFQEGVTRTFDEEAGRHRKFSLGAHELIFNPFSDFLGHGIFTPLFKTFLTCDIPSYYKIFLTAYLFSYTSGGIYIIVFTVAAITRLLQKEHGVATLYAFSPAGILILNMIVYYVIGYTTFLIALIRMHFVNKDLFFREYRKRGKLYLFWKKTRFALFFQILFYSAMGNFYFLGSMDHMLSRPGIVSATNKDSIDVSRCTALFDLIRFNSGSWMISIFMGLLAYATVLQDFDWDYEHIPDWNQLLDPDSELFQSFVFAAPTVAMAALSILVPILLNPYVLGWPCFRPKRPEKPQRKPNKLSPSRLICSSRAKDGDYEQGTNASVNVVDVETFFNRTDAIQKEINRVKDKPDVEFGSLGTSELRSTNTHSMVGHEGFKDSGYSRVGGAVEVEWQNMMLNGQTSDLTTQARLSSQRRLQDKTNRGDSAPPTRGPKKKKNEAFYI